MSAALLLKGEPRRCDSTIELRTTGDGFALYIEINDGEAARIALAPDDVAVLREWLNGWKPEA